MFLEKTKTVYCPLCEKQFSARYHVTLMVLREVSHHNEVMENSVLQDLDTTLGRHLRVECKVDPKTLFETLVRTIKAQYEA